MLWNLTGTLVVLLMRLSNFKAMQWFKLQISRLWNFTRSYHKTSYQILKRLPGFRPPGTMFCFRFLFRHAWLLYAQFMTTTVSRPFRVIWKRLRRPGIHFCRGICNYNNGDEYTHVMCLLSWWSHPMETFAALLAICVGNSPVPGEFPAQRPVTRNFDVFFDLRRSNAWVNSLEAGDLRRHRAHYDVSIMMVACPVTTSQSCYK